MIYLVRLDCTNDLVQRTGIVEVAVDQFQVGIGIVGILIDMIDSSGVERAGSADHARHLVAFCQKTFRQDRSRPGR